MGMFTAESVKGKDRRARGGEYITPGKYLSRIDLCKVGKNRKKIGFAAIETTVLGVIQHIDGQDGEPSSQAVHDNATWMVSEANEDYFLPECLEFIEVVAGVNLDESTDAEKAEALTMIFDGENPLGGTVVEIHAARRETQQGKPFTRIEFKRVVPASELRDLLDEEVIAKYYPGDMIDEMIAEEAELED